MVLPHVEKDDKYAGHSHDALQLLLPALPCLVAVYKQGPRLAQKLFSLSASLFFRSSCCLRFCGRSSPHFFRGCLSPPAESPPALYPPRRLPLHPSVAASLHSLCLRLRIGYDLRKLRDHLLILKPELDLDPSGGLGVLVAICIEDKARLGTPICGKLLSQLLVLIFREESARCLQAGMMQPHRLCPGTVPDWSDNRPKNPCSHR